MKKITLILFVLLLNLKLNSQNITYNVVLDNPSKHPKLSINTDIFQLDAAFRNIMGTSFNLGVWGYYEPVYGKMGVNFLARRSWFTAARLGNKNYPATLELDAGGYFIFRTTEKTKKVKITLKSTTSTNSSGREVTTETFIMVPAKMKSMTGIRAGLYHKSGPMEFEQNGLGQKDVKIDLETAISSQAVYGGLFTRKLTNIVIKTDKYGQKINSLGRELYIDAMLFLNNSFTSIESDKFGSLPGGTNVKDTVKANSKQGIMGFRMGYKFYQIAPKSEIRKKFGMSATFELGYRPYHGFFMNAGIGITLVKRRPNN